MRCVVAKMSIQTTARHGRECLLRLRWKRCNVVRRHRTLYVHRQALAALCTLPTRRL